MKEVFNLPNMSAGTTTEREVKIGSTSLAGQDVVIHDEACGQSYHIAQTTSVNFLYLLFFSSVFVPGRSTSLE